VIEGTRRNLIRQELQIRLQTLDLPVYYAETVGKQETAIYIWDGKETLTKEQVRRRNLYIRKISFNVYLEIRVDDKSSLDALASSWFDKIQAAVETDEDFSGLVSDYALVSQEIGIAGDNWAILQLEWAFSYLSLFMGRGVQNQAL